MFFSLLQNQLSLLVLKISLWNSIALNFIFFDYYSWLSLNNLGRTAAIILINTVDNNDRISTLIWLTDWLTNGK